MTALASPRPLSGFAWGRIVLFGVLAVCGIYAVYALLVRDAPRQQTAEFPQITVPARSGDIGWSDAVERTSNDISAREQRVVANPDDWGVLQSLAGAYVTRGRLTDNYADFAEADRLLARAFDVAREGTGPHRMSAAFHFLMHRLGRAEENIAAIGNYVAPLNGIDSPDIISLRADIAFYRGRYADALRLYGEAEEKNADSSNAFRLFTYFASVGNRAGAARYFRTMDAMPARDLDRAPLAIARGRFALVRGEYADAMASFRRADRLFPGDWRTGALIAQMAALDGDMDRAVAMFENIASEHESPEAMDALAAIYRYRGDARASRRWAERAGAIWDERLRLFPEAAYAHALDHELAFGDPARALRLARANWEARPYGAAAVGLTWALLANGQVEEARRIIEAVNSSAWESAEQHVAAAQVYAFLGDDEKAEEQRELALAINPRSLDREASLVWFGH